MDWSILKDINWGALADLALGALAYRLASKLGARVEKLEKRVDKLGGKEE